MTLSFGRMKLFKNRIRSISEPPRLRRNLFSLTLIAPQSMNVLIQKIGNSSHVDVTFGASHMCRNACPAKGCRDRSYLNV
jgi:hypothetical protein